MPIPPFVPFAAVALFLVGVSAFRRARRSLARSPGAWLEAARQLGLSFDETSALPRLEGVIGFVEVSVALSSDERARLEIQARAPFPPGLFIGREGVASAMGKLALGRDVEVGDPAFDRVVLIRGPEPAILSSLTPPVRDRLIRAVEGGYRLSDAAVRVEGLPGAAGAKGLVAAVRECVSLAEDLIDAFAQPIPAGLLANISSAPLPAARRRNLEVLLEGFEGEPVVEGLRTALADPLADNRRFAAGAILARPDGAPLHAAARLTLDELSRTGAGQLSLSAPGSEGAVSIAGEAGAVSIAPPTGKKD